MEGLIVLLAGVASLVSLGCFIYVLIKLFSTEGVMYGILGIICAIYAFIWGWQNAGKMQLQTVMMVWTGAILFGIITNVVAQVLATG